MKRKLEFDNAALAKRCEEANENHARDQERIADLLERTRELDSPSISKRGGSGRLETELEDFQIHENQMQVASVTLKWARLTLLSRNRDLNERNRQLLKFSQDVEAKKVMIQHRLDDMENKHAALAKKYEDIYQDKMMFESVANAARKDISLDGSETKSSRTHSSTHNISSTEVFKKIRDQLRTEKAKTAELEDENVELKKQLAQSLSNRGISRASLIDLYTDDPEDEPEPGDRWEELEQVRKVRKIKSAELEKAEKKNESLTNKMKTLEADLNSHRIMLQRTLEEPRPKAQTNKELEKTLDQIKEVTLGRVSSFDIIANDTIDQHVSNLADIIRDGRGRIAKKVEVQRSIQSRNTTFADVQLPAPIPTRTTMTWRRFSRFVSSTDL